MLWCLKSPIFLRSLQDYLPDLTTFFNMVATRSQRQNGPLPADQDAPLNAAQGTGAEAANAPTPAVRYGLVQDAPVQEAPAELSETAIGTPRDRDSPAARRGRASRRLSSPARPAQRTSSGITWRLLRGLRLCVHGHRGAVFAAPGGHCLHDRVRGAQPGARQHAQGRRRWQRRPVRRGRVTAPALSARRLPPGTLVSAAARLVSSNSGFPRCPFGAVGDLTSNDGRVANLEYARGSGPGRTGECYHE